MALADIENTNSPTAKHRKSAFGFESSYEKRWDSVIQLQALQKKTPHRYQQSPVFSRKVLSCGAEEPERRRHHHHHHHNKRRSTVVSRRRGNSDGDKHDTTADERVHLLSSVPWRKSADCSSSSEDLNDSEDGVDDSSRRLKFESFSPTLPNRLDSRLKLESHRHRSTSQVDSPLFIRREIQRARSQGSSPVPSRKFTSENAPPTTLSNPTYADINIGNVQYTGKLLINIQPIDNTQMGHILSPIEDVKTPKPDLWGFIRIPSLEVSDDSEAPTSVESDNTETSTGLLQVPTLNGDDETFPPPPSPETLRRYLGLETEPLPTEGLSEQELLKSRLMSRRFSTSSDSSTSTLT